MVPPDSNRVPRARSYLGDQERSVSPFTYGTFTRYGGTFQTASVRLTFVTSPCRLTGMTLIPTTPLGQRIRAVTTKRFRLIPFRSPLLRKSRLLSSPEATKMFQFASLPSAPYGFRCGSCPIKGRGFPHSEIPGSRLVWQLPEAYRSLPRPSSAASAKTSTVHP